VKVDFSRQRLIICRGSCLLSIEERNEKLFIVFDNDTMVRENYYYAYLVNSTLYEIDYDDNCYNNSSAMIEQRPINNNIIIEQRPINKNIIIEQRVINNNVIINNEENNYIEENNNYNEYNKEEFAEENNNKNNNEEYAEGEDYEEA
jgi:hypothetical protein